MLVIGGSGGKSVAEALAKTAGATLGQVEVDRFPDGEAYARVDSPLEGEVVVIVQTPVPDGNIVESMLLADAVARGDPEAVVLAAPYLPYARQDRVFQPGEALSAEVVGRALTLDVDALVTVDPHEDHVLDQVPVETAAATAVPEIAQHVEDEGVGVVLAPDAGALATAREAADLLGAASDHLEKTRLSDTEVRMEPKDLDVEDEVVLLLDDIISTGGTMARAVEALREQGARRILAAASHGLFVGDALENLRAAGCDTVLATDSLPSPVAHVSVAPSLLRALRELSVADLDD